MTTSAGGTGHFRPSPEDSLLQRPQTPRRGPCRTTAWTAASSWNSARQMPSMWVRGMVSSRFLVRRRGQCLAGPSMGSLGTGDGEGTGQLFLLAALARPKVANYERFPQGLRDGRAAQTALSTRKNEACSKNATGQSRLAVGMSSSRSWRFLAQESYLQNPIVHGALSGRGCVGRAQADER